MTQPNRHRIQRQIVELSLASEVAGPATHESFARSFREDIVPELNVVFDRAAGPHQLLRLDRLDIDLGTIASSDWQPELRRRLTAELTQRLARYTPESRTSDSSGSFDAGLREPLRQLLFYLAHGRLPWWGERPAAGWSASLPPTALDSSALLTALRAQSNARLRFVDSLHDTLLELAVTRWCGVPHTALALELMTRPGITPGARGAWRRAYWSKVLDAALEPDALPAQGPMLLRELLDEWLAAGAESTVVEEWARADPVAAGAAPSKLEALPSPWREWLAPARRLTPAARDADVAATGEAGIAGREPHGDSPRDHQRGRSSAPDAGESSDTGRGASPAAARDHPRESSSRAWADDEPIYLPGAGAVLLHPFLEPLFRDRGLLEHREFRDAPARARAVYLVGLLSFGRRTVDEYDLVTAKLLCGHPLDQPIAPVALDDADAAACEELLAAMLTHWSALRSSSTQWLRDQFFLRDGKLEPVDTGFRLTVERRAQDVLLARLPWGFGVIGLPWMNDKIFVRWLD